MLEEASGSFRIMELWGWKGLVGVILSSPLAQAVSSLQPPAQSCPSWEAAQGFVLWPEHLQGWRLYNLPGQTVHCLIALGVKKSLDRRKKRSETLVSAYARCLFCSHHAPLRGACSCHLDLLADTRGLLSGPEAIRAPGRASPHPSASSAEEGAACPDYRRASLLNSLQFDASLILGAQTADAVSQV